MVAKHRAQMEAARVRTIRNTRIGTAVAAVLALALGAVLSVVGLVGAVGLAPRGLAWLLLAGLISGGVGLGLLALAAALRSPVDLRTNGLPGRGTYREITGGGLSIEVNNSSMRGNIAQFAMKFEIRVEGRPPYEVVVKDFVPTSAVPRLVPGTEFAVFVDRKRPKRVLVDWEA